MRYRTFGRRITYLSSMPVFALFILGAGLSPTIAGVIVCRFLAGLAGSPGLAIGSATITDTWPPAQRAVPMALYVMTPFIGPAIGPLLGGFTASAKGWRWTLWTLLFLTTVTLTPTMFMSETYKKTILEQRLKMKYKKAHAAGDAAPELESKQEVPPPLLKKSIAESAKFFIRSTLTRPLHMALVEPVVTFFTIYVSLNIGMLYGFFAAFPYVFRTKYGFNLDQIGLTFLGLGVGALAGAAILITWSRLYYVKEVHRAVKIGNTVAPEARLGIAMIGSVMIPASLFLFGWTAEYSVQWIVPVIAEAFFGCGNL
jgi:MFS family permease